VHPISRDDQLALLTAGGVTLVECWAEAGLPLHGTRHASKAA
jgi:hypothetical protein